MHILSVEKQYANEFPEYWTSLECSFEGCTSLILVLPLNEIHCAFQGYHYIFSEARLTADESNFTTLLIPELCADLKWNLIIDFIVFPHYINSVH